MYYIRLYRIPLSYINTRVCINLYFIHVRCTCVHHQLLTIINNNIIYYSRYVNCKHDEILSRLSAMYAYKCTIHKCISV